MHISKKQERTTGKYAIAKYTQYFKYHRFTVNKDNLFFLLAVLVHPPQYYLPLLHISCFLYSLNKRSQPRQNLFSNTRENPAKTSKSRNIRFVARCPFWRFLLVNKLPLSIVAIHAQYRDTVPLITYDENSPYKCINLLFASYFCSRAQLSKGRFSLTQG